MTSGDGHRVIAARGKQRFVSCSRWNELGQALEWQARVSAHLGMPTEFMLLNPVQGITGVRCGYGDPEAEMRDMRRLIQTSPTGRTPLCAKIREVVARVEAMAPALRAHGQRVVVTIASDGLSTDGSIADAMRPLQSLPVWVVVRLCTDEDEVVEYWNNVDAELELDMDVLDDLRGEAKEVTDLSPWLVYGTALHRLREFGAESKLLDLMDERKLTRAEMFQMLGLLFGPAAEDLPHPDADWPAFEEGLAELLARAPQVWDPILTKESPWIKLSSLRRLYKPRKGVARLLPRAFLPACLI
jgi:hypothetical protein